MRRRTPSGTGKLTAHQRRRRYASRRWMATVGAALVLAALVAGDRFGVFGRAPTSDDETYDRRTFRVVRVVDGDTILIDVPDRDSPHTTVRFWGVDTPETAKRDRQGDHFADEATAFTRRWCKGAEVRIEFEPGKDSRGKYKRLLAWIVLADGRLLNRMLVEEGCAYADPRFAHHRYKEFRQLERAARQAGRGLWKDVQQEQLPPYYREGKHKLAWP